MATLCTLCESEITFNEVFDQSLSFCCHGCQAVYQIISLKNELELKKNHPIFKQAIEFGLISNPTLLQEIANKQNTNNFSNIEKIYLQVQDMWCQSCAKIIEYVLQKQEGIKSCLVDYATDVAIIEFSPMYLSKDDCITLIKKIGYEASSFEQLTTNQSKQSFYRLSVSAFCALNVMMFTSPIYAAYFFEDVEMWTFYFALLSGFLSIPSIFYCAIPIYKRFWNCLKIKILGMESLVVIGIVSGSILSFKNLFYFNPHVYFDSISVIIAFLLWGKAIESKAKFSAKAAFLRITKMLPKKLRKKIDNEFKEVALKEVKANDEIMLSIGEKVGVDAQMLEGEMLCDEAHLTGEPHFVYKQKGDFVKSGSTIKEGWGICKVVAGEKESNFTKIFESIEHTLNLKRRIESVTDSFSKILVPIIIFLTIGVGFYWFSIGSKDPISIMMAVLFISCPCAIGIAIPLVEAHLLQDLAQKGIIIRNKDVLQILGKETIWIWDKTGTLTEGTLSVSKGLTNLTNCQKRILKSLTEKSKHNISKAIYQSIEEPAYALNNIKEQIGKGIFGELDGTHYYLGSLSFLEQLFPKLEVEKNFSCQTNVYFFTDKEIITTLELHDVLRKDVENLLHSSSIQKVLLSGDNENVVSHFAKDLFDEYYAQQTPFQKKGIVENYQKLGHTVCMFGDGVNDALAMVQANVGVSLTNGAEITIQVSDVLVDPSTIKTWKKVVDRVILARRIFKQNLFWAFIYNSLGIALASFGLLTPLFASIAMALSSIFVILNSKRVCERYNWGL